MHFGAQIHLPYTKAKNDKESLLAFKLYLCVHIFAYSILVIFLIFIEYTKNEKKSFEFIIYSRDESPSKGGNDVFLRRRFSSVSENLQLGT